jgi:hypothetical protein
MNLLQRLKPEYKSELDLANVKFSRLIGYITDALEDKEFVKDLPYGVVSDLKFLLNAVGSPYELFNEI